MSLAKMLDKVSYKRWFVVRLLCYLAMYLAIQELVRSDDKIFLWLGFIATSVAGVSWHYLFSYKSKIRDGDYDPAVPMWKQKSMSEIMLGVCNFYAVCILLIWIWKEHNPEIVLAEEYPFVISLTYVPAILLVSIKRPHVWLSKWYFDSFFLFLMIADAAWGHLL